MWRELHAYGPSLLSRRLYLEIQVSAPFSSRRGSTCNYGDKLKGYKISQDDREEDNDIDGFISSENVVDISISGHEPSNDAQKCMHTDSEEAEEKESEMSLKTGMVSKTQATYMRIMCFPNQFPLTT